MLGNLFKSLFSKAQAQQEDPIEHAGYFITPVLEDSGGGRYYTRAKICKTIDGEDKEVMLIRADVHTSTDQAKEHSITKAKQVITEQGDGIFKQPQV